MSGKGTVIGAGTKMAENLLHSTAQVETKVFTNLHGRRSKGKYLLCSYMNTSFPKEKHPILGTYLTGKSVALGST